MPPDDMPSDQRGLNVLADRVTVALVERVLAQDEQIAELQRRLDKHEEDRRGLKWVMGAWLGFFVAASKLVIDYFRPPPSEPLG